MSDERLRELERRWKETGAVEDEAAFLLERVRTGELTQKRLELAAYCGNPAARISMADQAPPQFKVISEVATDDWNPEARESFRAFCVEILRSGGEAFIRGSIAAGWYALPLFETARAGDARPRRALETAEACVAGRAPEVLTRADRVADGAVLAAQSLLPPGSAEDGSFLYGGPQPPEASVAELAAYVCRLASTYARSELPQLEDDALNSLVELLGGTGVEWSALADAVARHMAAWATASVP